MIVKDFLFKVRTDMRGLMRYPSIAAGEAFAVDYDIYWHRRGGIKGRGLSAWQKNRADIAARFIEPGSRVLDLGAGDGAMLTYWRNKRHIVPLAVEVSKDSLAALKENDIEAFDLDITNPSALDRLPEVDYVTGFEILEHMPNPEALIHVLGAKARKGMIFSFPNTGYYTHRLRLLAGRFPLQWIAHPGEHLRYWTLADVRSWAPQIGTLKAIIPYQGVPVLSWLWPAMFAQGIIVIFD